MKRKRPMRATFGLTPCRQAWYIASCRYGAGTKIQSLAQVRRTPSEGRESRFCKGSRAGKSNAVDGYSRAVQVV